MERKWWHNKVAYQIYPKSFYDTNGDGIGDIPGIIEKLDYLQYLGVDIVWISPMYRSPLADQGYDISDYYQIDPRFGTMEDMERLLEESRKRQMYILMDLVVNHCSDEHEWFQKAMEDPEGEYGNFFYLAEQKDGRPSNWRSYFGGSVWEPMEGTSKQYLHMFHKKQPDLNWENPAVRREVYKNINWWLEKGVAGFRIDAIINIKKSLPFSDYPADREDGLASPDVMLAHAKGIGAFLREMRDETFARYQAFTVGEVFNEKREELLEFIGEDGYFSSMFDFNETVIGASAKGWYDNQPVTAEQYKDACFCAQEKIGTSGFYSLIIENHDEPRGVSHYLPCGQANDASKKMLAGLYFMMRGLPFIYQGQEIGMENVNVTSIGQVDDISSQNEYQVALDAGLTEEEALETVKAYSRDNGRTPMQWSHAPYAGFTTGTPWLQVNPNYVEINVEDQKNRPDSVLQFYRALVALRKSPEYQETIVYGGCIPYKKEQENLMAYYRESEEKTLLVVGNFQAEPQTMVLPGAYKKVLLNNLDRVEFVDVRDSGELAEREKMEVEVKGVRLGEMEPTEAEMETAGIERVAVRLEGWQYLVLEMEEGNA